MLYWLKFQRELKPFDLFKTLIWKTISNFLLFLEELNWENKISKYYFIFIQTYASLFAKEMIPKRFFKFALPKKCLKMNIKEVYYKIFSLISKGYLENPNLILALCK
jgi:hypothetical protein